MKHDKLIAGLVGAIVLTGIGSAGFAGAQTFNNAKQSPSSASNPVEFEMNELTPEEEAQQWQAMKQRFIDAGIQLTPQQETTIREAQRQLGREMQQLFQDNPLMTLAQLIAASSLPPAQGEAMMQMTGLDQRLGIPLLNYRSRILNALTPEQQRIWEEQIWQNQNQQTQSTENQWQVTTPNPDEQAAQWEQTKQQFIASGVPLTPQQETQLQAAEAKLQADLAEEFRSNPSGTFARFAAVAMLPAPITERFAKSLLGQAVITHWQSVDQILTPAQRQVWERRLSN